MSRRGRKTKAGKRTPSGALRRDNYPTPKHNKGSPWVQAMRERYGVHYNTALGRAYAGRLLGDEDVARIRYDTGKRFFRLYSAIIAIGVYACPLGKETLSGGSTGQIEGNPRAREDQDWLFGAMDAMDHTGSRPYFDQLISIHHVDQGPPWLDRILSGGNHPADLAILKAALTALDAITPAIKQGRILAEVY